jgi:hypothetical protein
MPWPVEARPLQFHLVHEGTHEEQPAAILAI